MIQFQQKGNSAWHASKIFPCHQSSFNEYINDLLSCLEHFETLLYDLSNNLVTANNTKKWPSVIGPAG